MIYFYQSISPQRIENLHNYMHHFFSQLLVATPPAYTRARYLHANFVVAATDNRNFLEKKLKKIHQVYSALLPPEKTVVQNAYSNNNDIVGICNSTVDPIKYSQLPNTIQQPVRTLYDSLWKMLSHKTAYVAIKNQCGSLKTHFETFRQTNTKAVCPFCGMNSLLDDQDEMKNAYDHYIPKSEYPFCSVNFKNLFPICDTCNKNGNKGFKDIPYDPTTAARAVLYFPYNNTTPNHKIKLKLNSASFDLSNKASWSLDIDCDPAANNIRKERWKEIYKIESRFKSKIASPSGNYFWKDEILKSYQKKSTEPHFALNQFKQDILDRYDDVFMRSNWIIEKCFHEFYLNDPNFDSSITSTT